MSYNLIEQRAVSCALTGHRKLGDDFHLSSLEEHVERLIEEGVVNFYCGMAQGFDLIAAEVVLKAKKNHPKVKLFACVPCPDQEKYFSLEDKNRYAAILNGCDVIERISDYYYKGCMLARDRFMVDNCSHVLAYLDKSVGGTAYTVRYAVSKVRNIRFM